MSWEWWGCPKVTWHMASLPHQLIFWSSGSSHPWKFIPGTCHPQIRKVVPSSSCQTKLECPVFKPLYIGQPYGLTECFHPRESTQLFFIFCSSLKANFWLSWQWLTDNSASQSLSFASSILCVILCEFQDLYYIDESNSGSNPKKLKILQLDSLNWTSKP